MNYIQAYLDEIELGHILVSQRVKKIYERLASEISDPSSRWEFNEELASRPIEFIEKFCRQSERRVDWKAPQTRTLSKGLH